MTAARLARAGGWLFVLLLVVIAARDQGAPGVATWAALGLGWTACACGAALLGRAGWRAPRIRFGMVAASAAWIGAAAGAEMGADGGLQAPWLLLAGVPVALQIVAREPAPLPRSPALAALLFAALALGLLATEPWLDRVGRVALGALIVTAVASSIVDRGRRIVPRGVPPPPRSAWTIAAASALLIAGAVLVIALAVDAALAPIPRAWNEPEPPPPKEDEIVRRASRARAELAGDHAIALVRVLPGEEDPVPPFPLYLRERVFDEVIEGEDGLVFLGPRLGLTAVLRDEDDSVEDQRIPIADERADAPASSTAFQITLLTEDLAVLPLVPQPVWIEGRSCAMTPDGAVTRPAGTSASFTYRTAGDVAAAFSPAAAGAVRAPSGDPRTAIPERFAGRLALEQLLEGAKAPRDGRDRPRDSLLLATELAAQLGSEGRLDPRAEFSGWAGFLRARTGLPLHFAQAFALAARQAGMPSRVVAGWRSHEFDAVDRRFEVRAGDVHYWTEIRFERLGWVGFDVAPILAADEVEPDPVTGAIEPQRDAVEIETVRETLARERPLVVGLLLLLVLAAFFAFPEMRLRIRRLMGLRPPSGVSASARRAWRFWQELLDCCRRFGLSQGPAETASEFARRLALSIPGEGPGVVTLLRVYHACRFGSAALSAEDEQRSRAALARMPAALQEWRRAPPDASRSRR